MKGKKTRGNSEKQCMGEIDFQTGGIFMRDTMKYLDTLAQSIIMGESRDTLEIGHSCQETMTFTNLVSFHFLL